jgi:transposase
MSLARLVVAAIYVEGRSKSEVAREYKVSRRWVQKLTARFDAEGEAGLEPRSRRPLTSPQRVSQELEEEIVALRKELAGQGLDAGAATIGYHLGQRHGNSPATSTIWRILTRRGFVTPQPRKRPRGSYARFAADQPNERWQLDITHWPLADGTVAEILNIIDDHSRLITASAARRTFTSAAVITVFRAAAATWGLPASMLSDIQDVCVSGVSRVVRPAMRGVLVTGACPPSLLTDRSAQLRDFLPVDHGAGRGAAEAGHALLRTR